MPAIIMSSGLQSRGLGAAGVLRPGGRDRVESRRAERAAADQTANRQPQPAGAAMGLDRLAGVFRAAREEATWRGPPVECPLVGADRAQHQVLGAGVGCAGIVALASSWPSSSRS